MSTTKAIYIDTPSPTSYTTVDTTDSDGEHSLALDKYSDRNSDGKKRNNPITEMLVSTISPKKNIPDIQLNTDTTTDILSEKWTPPDYDDTIRLITTIRRNQIFNIISANKPLNIMVVLGVILGALGLTSGVVGIKYYLSNRIQKRVDTLFLENGALNVSCKTVARVI